MPKSPQFLYEYLDIPENWDQPVAWAINRYDRLTEPHFDIHVGLELGIVLEGQSRRLYDGFSFLADQGQVWFAGLWEPHGFEICRPKTRHLVLGFLPEFLGEASPGDCDWMTLFNVPAKDRPSATPADRRFVLEIARRIQDLMAGRKRYWVVHLRLLVQELLLHFLERMPDVRHTPQSRDMQPSRQDLLPALMMVESRPASPLTLADAARATHMGRSKFAATFRSVMGVSFAKYLQRRRLAGVMRDLRDTDMKLTVLAQRWGFSDAPHLVRIFKGVVGQTPQTYRQAFQSVHGAKTVSRLKMPRVSTIER